MEGARDTMSQQGIQIKRYRAYKVENDVRTAAVMVRITTVGNPDLVVVCDEEEGVHCVTAVFLLGAGRNIDQAGFFWT
jgi:hypothetical protein